MWTIIATFTASATATATSTFTASATATRMFIASTNAQSKFLISRNKTLNRVPFNTNESGTNKKKTKHVKKLKPNKKITKLNELLYLRPYTPRSQNMIKKVFIIKSNFPKYHLHKKKKVITKSPIMIFLTNTK